MASIEFGELTKVFDDGTVAVDAFSLGIEDGEFVVLVGPSGSGKTTVLRMTAGLERPTSGEVRIAGEVVNRIDPQDRNIAMVFQNYALYPHMTVYDNMSFGLRLHGMKKREIRARVEPAAEMLGLSDLLKRKPAQLSGGQRQRVAMGRAIVREPDAFLMDEPLSNLDAKLRVEMRAYLGFLHQRLRTTTLYVTHDQTEAMTMGDRVAVMRGGRLEQCDEPQRLYDRPANLFVATFIGSPAMNLVRSRLGPQDGESLGRPRHDDAAPAARPCSSGGPASRSTSARTHARDPAGGHRGRRLRPERQRLVARRRRRAGRADGRRGDRVLPRPGRGSSQARTQHLELVAPLQAGGDHVTARLTPRSAARSGERIRLAVDVDTPAFLRR